MLWARLFSRARIDLGMSVDEVLRCKPRYLDMLFQRRHELDKASTAHSEYMLAQIAWVVANTGFKGWKEPRKMEEFMPSRHEEVAVQAKPKRRTKAERLRIVASWARSPLFAVRPHA